MPHETSVVDRINALLDAPEDATVGTSMRLPERLRDAAALAVEGLGVAPSATALTAAALRSRLEAIVMQAALDAHYDEHPGVRPTLAELAIASAELDGHPLARRPRLLREAAAAIVERHPDANAEAVMLWAEARAHGEA